MNDILLQIKEIFSRVLKVPIEKIKGESSPKTIKNWDSLSHVELVIEIEDKYGVSFGSTEMFALTSVQGFCDILVKKNSKLSQKLEN